ncbi:hypothetical protein [Aequorivita marisscotiae]|uniref:Uncharacterized protein n=1 Tax=Aequorivita marisscotiae TaxID=3040348 RepID=A0ABY8KVY5_9FLAO|nr:hypothetical protein [Aequorivita sp. Ant34-E75]WGF93574.1 hypothetical protein QCQ61_05120 [Aequorivita sp. Ant34-E75]
MKLILSNIEKELKKRQAFSYKWFQRQNDVWDSYTNFIYRTDNWNALIRKIADVADTQKLNKQHIFQYAANRWYNFWSARAVEQIFNEIEGVESVADCKDSEKDFYLFGIPFDHKTSVFPKQFGKTFNYAKTHKHELISWLYKNQSTQKRHHFKNRLFIVVYNETGEHWKLKAEISLLKNAIQKYVDSFRPEQLHSFTFVGEQKTFSDIIWVSQ